MTTKPAKTRLDYIDEKRQERFEHNWQMEAEAKLESQIVFLRDYIWCGYMERKTICVQCGFCCTQGRCMWGACVKHCECVFLLEPDEFGRRLCEKYDEISKHQENEQYPMFGSGCSSSLCNPMRDAVIQKLSVDPWDQGD